MIQVGAVQRGLPLSEFENKTIGEINDYIITYNNAYFKEETTNNSQTVRKATQADFDNF